MLHNESFLNLFQSKTTSYPIQKKALLVILFLEFQIFCMLFFLGLFLAFIIFTGDKDLFMLFLVKCFVLWLYVTMCRSFDRKNCQPELSYILAELFNKYLKESRFLDCWKVSLVVPIFKNVGERSTTENVHLASLRLVCKVFEKLVNNRIFDHLEKCGLFLIFSMVLGLLDQLQIL